MALQKVSDKWCPHPELNWDQRFRKPLLYPFELWGQCRRCRENTPATKKARAETISLFRRRHFA
jgi:hypothetical protein